MPPRVLHALAGGTAAGPVQLTNSEGTALHRPGCEPPAEGLRSILDASISVTQPAVGIPACMPVRRRVHKQKHPF